VCNAAGHAVGDELRDLVKQHPDDRFLVFALADLQVASGDTPDAERLLKKLVDDGHASTITVSACSISTSRIRKTSKPPAWSSRPWPSARCV